MFAKEEIELWDLSGNQSHLHNKDIFTKALEDIKNKGIKVLLIDEVQRIDEYHKILIDFIVKIRLYRYMLQVLIAIFFLPTLLIILKNMLSHSF